MTRASPKLALVWVAIALGGCFRATVRSGAPPGSAPDAYDPAWHHGFAAGVIEESGPHALHRICPEGWALVETRTNAYETLLHVVTWTIYAPQDVTIVCAGPPTPPEPDL